MPATAARAALTLVMFGSTAEGTTVPGGRSSTAKSSNAPPRDHRAPATRPEEISQANSGCGLASSHWAMRRTREIFERPFRKAAELFNECQLVDFAQRGNPGANYGIIAFA